MIKNLLKTTVVAILTLGFTRAEAQVVSDNTVSDFNGGTMYLNTLTSPMNAGSVTVTSSTLYETFTAFSQPLPNALWNGGAWVAGGQLTINNIGGGNSEGQFDAFHFSSITNFSAGATIEFRAKFDAVNFQSVGFGSGVNFSSPYAAIGRGSAVDGANVGTNVYARLDDGTNPVVFASLSGTAAGDGNYHDYKIVWNGTSVDFYVDGGNKQTLSFTAAPPATMNVQASDLTLGGGLVKVDYINAGPNYNYGQYLSKVFDGVNVNTKWSLISWDATIPAGSSLRMYYRSGPTPTPDGSWTGLTEVTSSSGSAISVANRYFQYFTELNTNSGAIAPSLNLVTLTYGLLPVTLTELSASANGNAAKLDWATVSESNNKGFNIYRSNDGVKWAPVGFVAGVGNSSTKQKYSFNDGNLADGKYFYRLRQDDIDGHFAFSNIVSVKVSRSSSFSLSQNYPNPATFSTMINYSVPSNARVRITLYDGSGHLVKVVEDAQRKAGNYSVMVDASRMKSGVYYYKIEADGQTMTRKMAIQN